MADKEAKPRILTRGGSRSDSDRTLVRLVPRVGASDARYNERKPRWSIDLLRLVTLVIVVLLLIHGLALILRAGFDDFELFESHTEVAGLHGTRMAAIIETVFGLILLYTIVGIVDQTALRVIGFFAIIAGAVLIIEPDSIHEWVGLHEDNGVVALVIGAALVLGSMTPVLNIYPKPPPIGRAPWER